MNLKLILLIGYSFLLSSCVGTIEEANPPSSFSKIEKNSSLQFAGIQEVKAISDSRLEVFFNSAQGGTGLYNYKINLGGGILPVSVPSEVLTTDYRGYLKHTLTNLNPGYLYKVSIDVEDQTTLEFTKTDVLKEARTFNNSVCNFNGIRTVENLPGMAGTDSLLIKWTHAEVKSDGFQGVHAGDPKEYEISLLDTSLYNPSNFLDVGLNNDIGRYTALVQYNSASSEYLFRGLPSGREFWVKVRCFNSLNRPNDKYKPWLDGELNTNYVRISTLDDNLANITWNAEDIILVRGTGAEATKTFSVSWSNIQGVFDHYRLYYTQASSITINDDCQLNEPVNGIYCKKVPFINDRVQVFPLTENTTYKVQLVICQDFACTSGKRRIVKEWDYDTTVPTSAFFGLTNITEAKSLSELGTLKLFFSLPNLANGTFDGYVVKYKSGGLTSPEVDISDPSYTGPLGIFPYNPQTDTSLTIDGINYSGTHCFNLSVFRWNNDGSGNRVITSNDVWMCREPVITPPTQAEFVGLKEVQAISNQFFSQISLTWDQPTSGVYENYKVFVLHNSAQSFSFADAIAETSAGNFNNYYLFEVDSNQTDLSLAYASPSTRYRVGILTSYKGGSNTYYSQLNTRIYTCDVPALASIGNPDNTVNCAQ